MIWGSAPNPGRSGLWGSAPNPVRFFKKSGGKTMFLPASTPLISFVRCLQVFPFSGGCEPQQFTCAAAVSRCNLRGRARKNNVFCFSRTNARLCGINSTAQTKTKIQIKKAVKQSLSFCNFANQQAKIINFIFRATMLFHRTYIQAVNLKQKPYLIKKKKAAKCRVNGVSGTLCGKTLFFPRFF